MSNTTGHTRNLPATQRSSTSDKQLKLPKTLTEGMEAIPKLVQTLATRPHWLIKRRGIQSLEYILEVYHLANEADREEESKRKYGNLILKSGMVNVFLMLSKEILPTNYTIDADMTECWEEACEIICGATDSSEKLCRACVDKGIAAILLSEFKKDQFSPSKIRKDSAEFSFTKTYLGMLHNMLRWVPAARYAIRSASGVATLERLMTSDFYIIKVKCLINLGYIVDENQTDRLITSERAFAFLITMLKSALKNKNHKDGGFSAEELVAGMNKVAANEKAKEVFIRDGTVQLYLTLLNDTASNDLERSRAANGLWILSFVGRKDLRTQMRNEPGLEKTLTRIVAQAQKSHDDFVKDLAKKASGTLWELLGGNSFNTNSRNRLQSTRPTDKNLQHDDKQPHVMLSYNHRSAQTQMLWLNQQLKSNGFKVWIDVEQMHGDTLEAMAEAVENAAVVLVSVTQRYKESPACRKEASYADVRKIPIVPLLIEENYSADGWLGLLIANKLWFNLSTEERREQQLSKLIEEISHIIAGEGTRISEHDTGQQPISHDSAASHVEPTLHRASSSLSSVASNPVAQWTETDVALWSERNGLWTDKFKGFNGPLLLELQALYQVAPSFACERIEIFFELDLLGAMKFLYALRQL